MDGRGKFPVCVLGAAQKKFTVHRDIFVSGSVGEYEGCKLGMVIAWYQ